MQESDDVKWHIPNPNKKHNIKTERKSYIAAKGSIPLYQTYDDTLLNSKRKANFPQNLKAKKQKIHHVVNQNSNKHMLPEHELPLNKRLKQEPRSQSEFETFDEPQGLIWDGENYSCAYDALFSILRHLWSTDDIKWTEQFSNISALMKLLCQGLHDVKSENITFEQMRDNIRQILHHDFPNSFPYGYRGASVTELAHKMFYNEAMNAYTQLDCAECQFRDDATEDRLSPVLSGLPHISNTTRDLLKTTFVSQSRCVLNASVH